MIEGDPDQVTEIITELSESNVLAIEVEYETAFEATKLGKLLLSIDKATPLTKLRESFSSKFVASGIDSLSLIGAILVEKSA